MSSREKKHLKVNLSGVQSTCPFLIFQCSRGTRNACTEHDVSVPCSQPFFLLPLRPVGSSACVSTLWLGPQVTTYPRWSPPPLFPALPWERQSVRCVRKTRLCYHILPWQHQGICHGWGCQTGNIPNCGSELLFPETWSSACYCCVLKRGHQGQEGWIHK